MTLRLVSLRSVLLLNPGALPYLKVTCVRLLLRPHFSARSSPKWQLKVTPLCQPKAWCFWVSDQKLQICHSKTPYLSKMTNVFQKVRFFFTNFHQNLWKNTIFIQWAVSSIVFSRFCYVLLCNHEYIHCLNHRQAKDYITRRNETKRKLWFERRQCIDENYPIRWN